MLGWDSGGLLHNVRRSVDSAHDDGVAPRVHGNGMVQLDLRALGQHTRLHIWGHPKIPCQDTYTGIHDHSFSFRSIVLVGQLTNVRYFARTPGVGDEYRVYRAVPRDGEDTELVLDPAEAPLVIEERERLVLAPGSCYREHMGDFHESYARQATATLMTKTSRRPGPRPRVLCPVKLKPDNKFNRNAFSAQDLWRIIGETVF